MGLEGLDHSSGLIAALHVGGGELVGCLPFFFNLEFVCGAAFVVYNLQVNTVTVLLEAVHDAV